MSLRELVETSCGTQNPLSGLARQLLSGRQNEGLRALPSLPVGSGLPTVTQPASFYVPDLLQQIKQSFSLSNIESIESRTLQLADGGAGIRTLAADTTQSTAFSELPLFERATAASSSSSKQTTALHNLDMPRPLEPPALFEGDANGSMRPALLGGVGTFTVPPWMRHVAATDALAATDSATRGVSVETSSDGPIETRWAVDILADSEQHVTVDELEEFQRVVCESVHAASGLTPADANLRFTRKVGSANASLSEDLARSGTNEHRSAEKWAGELLATADKQQRQRRQPETSQQGLPTGKVSERADDSSFWRDLAALATARGAFIGDEYIFGENPLHDAVANDASLDPFAEGVRRFHAGDLPSAVLLFEAAVRRDSSHAAAWHLLGEAQAQNEQEQQAIRALRRSLRLQPTNGVAMLSLACSYANEDLDVQVFDVLLNWLRLNPKYAHLAQKLSENAESKPLLSATDRSGKLLTDSMYQNVLDTYIAAAQIDPDTPDVDVQSALGLLLSLKNEHAKSADCFRAAIVMQPDDPVLWNRLGASLSNSGRSAEAIEAYRRSLDLHPGFIRARFNLGIACIRLEAYHEAAEHLLTALNLQNAGSNVEEIGGVRLDNTTRRFSVMSRTIWDALRMCLTLLHRPDLYAAVDREDLVQLNEQLFSDTTKRLTT